MLETTKTRMKNFYVRNADFVHVTTIYLAASAALIFIASDAIKGMHISGAEFMTDADGKAVLLIDKKNGSTTKLYQNNKNPKS